jgi:hypothetical protein
MALNEDKAIFSALKENLSTFIHKVLFENKSKGLICPLLVKKSLFV